MAKKEQGRRPAGHTSAAEKAEGAPQGEGQGGHGRAVNGSQPARACQPTCWYAALQVHKACTRLRPDTPGGPSPGDFRSRALSQP